MAEALPETTSIVASDLNQAMLDQAESLGTARSIEWRNADALQLPFDDGRFDAVVCQFGAMFFPDRAKGFSEARRVLKPGGLFLFNVWDAIEHNEFADTVTNALASFFPDDPPRFLPRTPYGYNDVSAIERDLDAGGFNVAKITTVTARVLPRPHMSRRWVSARGHRCAARSKRGSRAGSTKRPVWRPTRSRRNLAAVRLRRRSRRT